jgi:hypothetical protein
LQELAVVGAGLRFDFSFLVLRTDLAFPIRKPYLQEGDRWVLDQVRLGASSWRKENLVLTSPLAIHFNSVVLYLYLYSNTPTLYKKITTNIPFNIIKCIVLFS